MRRARHKSEGEAFYHIVSRVAGFEKDYPLERPEARARLVQMLFFYIRVYCCRLICYEIMGNHYHFIVWMEKLRRLSRDELRRRADLLWGEQAQLKTAGWGDPQWGRFHRKLFDLSALMQHLNGEYAKWFNRRYQRRGHFWGDRFKSLQLLDLDSVQKCLLYIETNATRAELVEHPHQWEASSAWLRTQGPTEQLVPLEQIFPPLPNKPAFEIYSERLEARQHADRAQKRTASSARQRWFTEGLALGSRTAVAQLLNQYRATGRYRRRKHPIYHPRQQLYALREQRSHERH